MYVSVLTLNSISERESLDEWAAATNHYRRLHQNVEMKVKLR